jgi:hypothetical protein
LSSELLAGASERILYAEHLEGDGAEIHERTCAMGLAAVIDAMIEKLLRDLVAVRALCE